MKFFYSALLLIFPFMSIIAQVSTSNWYSTDNGLPQNTVKDIIKDKYGFIWLATESGILRYDGSNFIRDNRFKSDNLFLSDFLGSIEKDSILTFNYYNNAIKITGRKIQDTLLDKKYFQLPDKNKTYRKFYKNSLTGIFYPDVDYYYIKTNTGIYYFNNHTLDFSKDIYSPKKNMGLPIGFNQLKNIFVHGDQIFIADPVKRKTIILSNGKISYDNKPNLYNDPTSRIYWHQTTGQIFVIHHDKIYLSEFNKGKPILRYLLSYPNIGSQFFCSLFYDRDYHKMYFGSLTRGLNIVTLSGFYTSQKKIPFANEVSYAALPFGKNAVITQEGILYTKSKAENIFPLSLNYDKRNLLYDNSGNLIYKTNSSIIRRLKKTNYATKDSTVFPGKRIDAIFKSRNLYMANMVDEDLKCHLYIFKNDDFSKTGYRFVFNQNINSVIHYDKNHLYVGTNDGLHLVSLPERKIIRHFARDIPVKQIIRTKDGRFWFTTHNKGWYSLNGSRVIRLPDDSKGMIASAHTLAEDAQSNFWISSNNGLFKVPEKAVLDYLDRKRSFIPYYRYTKVYGLYNNEFNGSSNPSVNLLKNGEMVFPSMEGFVFFIPESIRSYYPRKDQLFIERMKTGHKNSPIPGKILLNGNFKPVEIYVDIPYYYSTENIALQAKLENSDDEQWKTLPDNRMYTLSDIAPGNYTLVFRYLTSARGTFAYKKIPVMITPLFYQTLLFKALVIAFMILIIAWLIHLRTRFLRNTNRKLEEDLSHRDHELKLTSADLETTKNRLKTESDYKQQLVQSISHDITTPVKFITLLSEKIAKTDDQKLQKKYFDSIYKSSEQLYKFTQGLKKYSELYAEEMIYGEKYALTELIEEKKTLFQEIALMRGVHLFTDCPPAIETCINRSMLGIVLHNLIDNAVKYTVNGTINITAENSGNKITITVSDTGKGMAEDQILYYSKLAKSDCDNDMMLRNYGLGLHMVIQLIKKIKAVIRFENNSPYGTLIKIDLHEKH